MSARKKDMGKIDPLVAEYLAHAVPGLLAVYRFGSFGTPGERKESDIDLAFLAEAPVPNITRWNLAQELASTVGRNVDLVDLRQATTVMRMQVVAQGTRFTLPRMAGSTPLKTWCFQPMRA
ncbi:type VII toxin-antitoxin system MntA family adenylyltransferase antitoxin [Geoalkalibacter halelectricus]|uniref:Nucleotidyltransferase domain-containing protein n=1 Tax=Geoalkalibacter halelectricus TaxID=2847045 RepID=A0ABY5ZSU8_9BACT|nr:nucleotidyltransferase domain-containing protein [Geoalkalibacter halelectricus]MDO3378364.1 nucleotidyltransferase domain-containing protein [Geoalkalibacter halelectricus]UWZ80316.1 nucleotidyltransferase domain-containing protein [Geoalkalibacter halelectricus]